jgi:hypothetical protein
VPFQAIVELDMKPLPVTATVKAEPPTVTTAGETLEMLGAGLALLIVNIAALELEAPALRVTTLAYPAFAIRLADTWAVTWVLLTKVVLRF